MLKKSVLNVYLFPKTSFSKKGCLVYNFVNAVYNPVNPVHNFYKLIKKSLQKHPKIIIRGNHKSERMHSLRAVT